MNLFKKNYPSKKEDWDTILPALIVAVIIFLPLILIWAPISSKINTLLWQRPVQCYHHQSGYSSGLILRCYQNISKDYVYIDNYGPENSRFEAAEYTNTIVILLVVSSFLLEPKIRKFIKTKRKNT